jgi:Phage integrase, N-terminal SAM-like domain
VGWLAIERRKIDLGTWGAVERSDGVTLRAYAQQWLEHPQLRPRTRQLYESLLDRLILPELGEAKIVTLTPAKIREWHSGLGADHLTRNAHAYSLLHVLTPCNLHYRCPG